MIPPMDTNPNQSSDDMIRWLGGLSGTLLILLIAGVFFVWLLLATIALIVAPDDHPWHFFWCTFLLLGPLGVALALVAPSRPNAGGSD